MAMEANTMNRGNILKDGIYNVNIPLRGDINKTVFDSGTKVYIKVKSNTCTILAAIINAELVTDTLFDPVTFISIATTYIPMDKELDINDRQALISALASLEK